MPIQYVDEQVPETQPERAFQFPGELIEFGFTETPKFKREGPFPVKQARMFVYGINPLSFGYDRNPEGWQYEQQENHRRTFMNYLDKNGNPINANSPYGIVKAAFAKLGYPFKTTADAQKLIGKKFLFEVQEISFGPDSKPVPVDVPISELPTDYTWTGKHNVTRIGYDSAPTVDAEQEAADVEALRTALEGKAENEFILALAKAGLGAYMTEASAGQPLINRMKRHGMDLVDGRLVTVNG